MTLLSFQIPAKSGLIPLNEPLFAHVVGFSSLMQSAPWADCSQVVRELQPTAEARKGFSVEYIA